ncbi:MAG: hypothetical protein IV090_11280 [Candidatus Sericytochromatia bacterium]|nr:hypothetical protein [Candidatus Sericytochromatia bacterium]
MRKTFAFTLILIMLTGCAYFPSAAQKTNQIEPPRSLHSQLKSSEISSKLKLKILSEVSSWDQSGHFRLQLRLQSPRESLPQTELRQALYQSLRPYLPKYSVIWAEVTSNQDGPHWLARADWFAPEVPPHLRYSISQSQETFRGLKIEYSKH